MCVCVCVRAIDKIDHIHFISFYIFYFYALDAFPIFFHSKLYQAPCWMMSSGYVFCVFLFSSLLFHILFLCVLPFRQVHIFSSQA